MKLPRLSLANDRRSILFLACAFLLGGLAALAGVSMVTASQDAEVVATVNGEPILRNEFFERLQDAAGEQVLDQMILEKLIAQAEGAHGVTVSDEEVQRELDAIKRNFGSEEEFQAELDRYRLSLERLLHEIRLNLILTKLTQKDVKVTDEEIAEFFEANKELLRKPAQVKVRHILVETKAEAEEILEELRNGADFAALAKARSIDTASGAQGGEIGFIHEGSAVVDEFKKAALSLGAGELSEPVETQFGWHIIRVDERTEAVEATLENSRETIREHLASQKAKPVGEVLNELRSAAKIEVNWSRYQSLAGGAGSE